MKQFKLIGLWRTCLTRAAIVATLLASPAFAQDFDNVLEARLLTGWRQGDGNHMAAIQIDLAPGWHTYWRAPGDAGIPTLLDTRGSTNLRSSSVIWPRPIVIKQNGFRSIGYKNRVILPLRIAPKDGNKDIAFEARIDLGVCKDICIPRTLNVKAVLPKNASARDARIASALSDLPYTAREAGARNVTCALSPSADGLNVTARFDMPAIKGNEAVVIETGNPLHWVSTPKSTRSGKTITATAEVQHVEGAPLVIKRDAVIISIIGSSEAVEIKGCGRG